MKRRGARVAREKFCGAHSNFSTDCTCKGAGDWKLRQSTLKMSDNPLHSAGFPGYCSLMDLNGCVVTCMRFPLLFEPLKIYHHMASVFRRRFALYVTCPGLVSLLC